MCAANMRTTIAKADKASGADGEVSVKASKKKAKQR